MNSCIGRTTRSVSRTKKRANVKIREFLFVKRKLINQLSDERYRAIQGTMDTEHAFALFLVIAAVALFASERYPVDLVALMLMGVLLVSGIVTAEEGISGFSNTATVTVGAMFILSAGLFKTGVVNMMGAWVVKAYRFNFWVALAMTMVVAGALSAFINNTPVVAIFIPITLGVALEKTGAALFISQKLLALFGSFGPVAMVATFYLLTSLLTEMMSNNATAVLLAPIVIATAGALEADPRPFLMAIAFASSASFMTPVGYQTNTMIYSVGRYRFADFLRVGTPLNILFFIIAPIFIPVFWPL